MMRKRFEKAEKDWFYVQVSLNYISITS